MNSIDNHPYSTGMVCQRINQDKAAGLTILFVAVKQKWSGTGNYHASDLVELEGLCCLSF